MARNITGKHAFVFYESFYESYKYIPTWKEKAQYLEKIIEFGLFRTEPKVSNYQEAILFDQIKTSIIGAQNRYNKSCSDGTKGGAPKENQNAVKEVSCRKCSHRKTCKDYTTDICIASDCQNFNLSKEFINSQKNSQNNLEEEVEEDVDIDNEDEKDVEAEASSNLDFLGTRGWNIYEQNNAC